MPETTLRENWPPAAPGKSTPWGLFSRGVAGLGGFDAEFDGQVCLADPGRAEEDHVLRLRDERAGGQVGCTSPVGMSTRSARS